MSNIKIPKSKHAELFNDYCNSTVKEVAIKYNVSEATVSNICRRKFKCKGLKVTHSKDEAYFEQIDSHEKAYILGLIYSDGHINTANTAFGISLSEKDKHVIDYFKESLKFTGPITNIKKKQENHQNSVGVMICSKKMCLDLNKLGVLRNKSLILEWPAFLEKSDFIWSFLLGYFDGDGCIGFYDRRLVATMTSSTAFCIGLENFSKKNDISCFRRAYGNKQTSSVLYHFKNAKSFLSKIFEFHDFSMKRKRDKANFVFWCSEHLMNGKILMRGSISQYSFDLFQRDGGDALLEYVKANHEKVEAEKIKKFSETIKKKKLPTILLTTS